MQDSELQKLKDQNEVMRLALLRIFAVLGPNVPKCIKDSGCRWEWDYALRTAKQTLGIKDES